MVLSVIVSGCLSSEDAESSSDDDSGGYHSSREVRTPVGMETSDELVGTQEEMETTGDTEVIEETETTEEMETSGEMETTEEMETSGEIETSAQTDSLEQTEAAGETLDSEVQEGYEEEQTGPEVSGEKIYGGAQSREAAQKSHLVRIKNYLLIPSTLEISPGDLVVWRNYQEPSVFTLTSKEGLFEDKKLVYGDTLEYVFTEPGTYSFNVKGYPQMKMTITVK